MVRKNARAAVSNAVEYDLSIADTDGLGQMHPVTPLRLIEGPKPLALVPASYVRMTLESADDVLANPMIPVATIEPVADDANIAAIQAPVIEAVVANVSLRLPVMFLTESAARQMAELFCAKLGMPIELIRDGAVVDTVFRGGGRAVASATRVAKVKEVAPPKAERDWATFDPTSTWGANPASYAQAYFRQWQAIRGAAVQTQGLKSTNE
jgi:hypothetical protein